MGGRHFVVRRLVIAIVVWAVGFVGLPTLTAEAACSDTQLVPAVGRWEVNQGLGSYDRLTRGKDILVRLYLTLPPTSTCSLGGSQAITITGASLTVTGAGSSPSMSPINAANLSSNNLTLPPALPNSNHDPLFQVAGSVITSSSVSPAATGTPPTFPSFAARFDVTVTYRQKISASITNTKTALFSTNKIVDQQSKAVRILFQPVGDGTSATTQFTDSDRTAVQNAVQTLLRTMPVPAGPAGTPLTAAARTGGIRYDINPSLLDVSGIASLFKTVSVGGTNVRKFCATQSGFTTLAPQLGTRLDSFNTLQPSAEDAADFIVGVYGEQVSWDSAQGCALGMAAVGSKVTIARADTYKPKVGTTPEHFPYTGAVMAMEITHNIGGQPSPRSSTYHSSYVQSDNTDPDGAYSLSSGVYLSADKTVMNIDTSTSSWDNNVTVLEKPDYEYNLCRFGGTILSGAECTTPVTGGTLTGVAAIDAYAAAGNTSMGLLEGYHATSALTATDDASPYRLLRLIGGAVINGTGTGIPVAVNYTHGEGSPNPGLFSFAVPASLLDGADEVKLVFAPTGSVVFDVSKQASPPAVTAITAESNDLLAPGQSTMLTKSVTPPPNPDGDIVFLADTTGSMVGAIADVQAKARTVIERIRASQPTSQFAVANYKDFNVPAGCSPSSTYAYRLDHAITDNIDDAISAIGTWAATGGCDDPEAQINALHQLVTSTAPATGFRTPALPRAVAWFGDQPGHNPSGPDQPNSGITLGTAISDLRAAGIRVVAVSVGSIGLDQCPSENGTSTPLPCPGQATRIAEATGGTVKSNASSDQVADALLDGLFSATVEPHATCDSGLSIAIDPTRQVVDSRTPGEAALFNETVLVAPTATDGKKSCTVDFSVNGKPSSDPNFHQVITVAVGSTTVTVRADATSGNPNSVADFIYHCPGTAFYPVATAVPRTGNAILIAPDRFSLTFETKIDSGLVPGGVCTLSALVTDQFQRSAPSQPAATTTFNVTKKKPLDIAIYTPTESSKFGPQATILATGGGSDPEGGAMSFSWSLTGPGPYSTTASGASAAFVRPTPQWTAGDYTLTLTGTDPDGNSSSATRTFSVVAESALPPTYGFVGFFTPAKNWPDVNAVNAGQAFTAKWILRDVNGQDVTTTAAIFGAQLQQVNCTTRAAMGSPVFTWQVGATMLRYDSKGGQWVANVSIPSGVGLCYTWTLELADGSLHPLFLQTVK